jgi:hypothetical protein
MSRVVLDESEQRIARWLAQSRYQANRRAGIENRRIGPQSDEDTDLDGIGAEMAAAKALNVYPDLSTEPRAGGHDLIANGKRVDVKATRYKSGHLLAAVAKSASAADVYMLAVGEFPEYELVGWAYADDLLSIDNLTDLGHGQTYAMAQHQLRPLRTGKRI